LIQRRRLVHPPKFSGPSSIGKILSIFLLTALLFLSIGFVAGWHLSRNAESSIGNTGFDTLKLSQRLTIQGKKIDSLFIVIHHLEQKIAALTIPNSAESRTTGNLKKESSENARPFSKLSYPISLQILNGCGAEGITQKMAEFLKKYQVTIKSTGNYKSFKVKHSFFISQKKIPSELKGIASLIGIPTTRIYRKKVKSSSSYILVIGKDYPTLKPFKK
jgi:hypothetical protein